MEKEEIASDKSIICKVQLPLMTTESPALAFIYNRDRSFTFHTPVTLELRRKMRGTFKDFFWVDRVSKQVLERATWQNW